MLFSYKQLAESLMLHTLHSVRIGNVECGGGGEEGAISRIFDYWPGITSITANPTGRVLLPPVPTLGIICFYCSYTMIYLSFL